MSILKQIDSPVDLKSLRIQDLEALASELREFVLNVVSTKEGHLGASLGVVELTLALHYFYNAPEDKIVWDVGHQAYIHKIITGRREQFHSNRQKGGLSGFPSIFESKYDEFGTGHSSTSISAVLGMAIASRIKKENRKHIAVIGDASIASGMAFEALNHAAVSKEDIIVILNDNGMGIDPHVGALKDLLSKMHEENYSGDNIFKALGFEYFGVVDGHDIGSLLSTFEQIEKVNGPKFIHIKTVKGKGYTQAENDQVRFHAPGKFDLQTGESISSSDEFPLKYQDVFGKTMLELAEKDQNIYGITPAMPTGSSLKYMMEKYPERSVDVGISEQHAVTLAAGMAKSGLKPFLTIYSTFLQRAYDQVIHDVALQNLPVVFCIDRAGIVGEDGATHHGLFDVSFLRAIPNIIVSAPMTESDLRSLMKLASETKSPFAIRYPRGRGVEMSWNKDVKEIKVGESKRLSNGKGLAILSYGHIGNEVQKAINSLDDLSKSKISFYNMLFAKPMDFSALNEIANENKIVLTIEDGIISGGFGQGVQAWYLENNIDIKIQILGLNDEFSTHGRIAELLNNQGLSAEKILKKIKEILSTF